MLARTRKPSKNWTVFFSFVLVAGLAGLVITLVSCGSTTSGTSRNGTGTINVSLTDPPSCAYPNGAFDHVYVTIRSVQANISATASDTDPGWQELAPQLNNQPVQIDLFSAGANACLLANLGSNQALPAGSYQQIRLLLVPNSGSSGPLPANNACGSQGYNCVVTHDGTVHELQLSSQANTGLKIPPGQILGGPITVSSGQDVDLNIDFNACASIIREGNGQYRLKPVLTAGQVSTNRTGISGQLVDAKTGAPIVGGTVMVAVEQQGSNGADTIVMQAAADSNGDFNFCPLPSGETYDVVADAINGAGAAYNATVAIGVPGGTNLGTIPLIGETATPPAPTTFQGTVTASASASSAASIYAAASALQQVTLNDGSSRFVVIPAGAGSVASIDVQSSTGCPLNTNCAQYSLIEPASNPSTGEFVAGKIQYSTPAAAPVPYEITVNASSPVGDGTPYCSPSSQSTTKDINNADLAAVPGETVTPAEIDFTSCVAN